MPCFIGIDPGLKGGLAALDDDGDVIDLCPMPLLGGEIDAAAVWRWVVSVEDGYQVGCVTVEKVASMPKQGVASTFRFGLGFGLILGAVAVGHWRREMVTPQRWKAAILRDTDKSKDAAIAYCARRWPGVELVQPRCRKPHDGIADALCLAEYGRLHCGRINQRGGKAC